MGVGCYVDLLKAEQTVGDKRSIKYKYEKGAGFKEFTTCLQYTMNIITQKLVRKATFKAQSE